MYDKSKSRLDIGSGLGLLRDGLPILGLLVALAPSLARSQAAGPAEPLWPGGAPGAKGTGAADIPTIQAFLPAKEKANGAAIVICPGGGYGTLATLKEGNAPAEWMKSLGVAAFVLKYRLGPTYRHPIEMGDAQRAMRWVRANAARFGVDTARVGIMGFSAGGHLASTAATHYDAGLQDAPDTVDRQSCRPAFHILVYPVITMDAGFTHSGSRSNLLGSSPRQSLVDSLSSEKMVTPKTPPAFLVHSVDDGVVQVRNARVYVDSCKKKGVPVEYREYRTGGHGYGLADGKNTAPNLPEVAAWTRHAAAWLEAGGFFKESTALGPLAREDRRTPARPARPAFWGATRDALGRWMSLSP